LLDDGRIRIRIYPSTNRSGPDPGGPTKIFKKTSEDNYKTETSVLILTFLLSKNKILFFSVLLLSHDFLFSNMFVSMSCVAAVSLKGELGLPLAHIFQGVQILQQTALEKLAAKQKYVNPLLTSMFSLFF
jgi:hypothetical protein